MRRLAPLSGADRSITGETRPVSDVSAALARSSDPKLEGLSSFGAW
jgi:hypothetical protein